MITIISVSDVVPNNSISRIARIALFDQCLLYLETPHSLHPWWNTDWCLAYLHPFEEIWRRFMTLRSVSHIAATTFKLCSYFIISLVYIHDIYGCNCATGGRPMRLSPLLNTQWPEPASWAIIWTPVTGDIYHKCVWVFLTMRYLILSVFLLEMD